MSLLLAAGATGAQLAATIAGSSALSANLNTSITMASTIVGSSALSANLTTSITMASTIAGSTTLSANLTTSITMKATIAGSTSLSAALTTAITMAATIAGSTSLTAPLTTAITMASTIAGSSSLSAALSTAITMAATVAGSTALSASLGTSITMASTIAGSTSLTANLNTSITAATTIAGSTALSASLSTAVTAAATIAGSTSISAALTTSITMAATIAGSTSISADLTATSGSLAATVAGSTSLSANLTTSITMVSTIAGSTALSANLTTSITMASTIAGSTSLAAALNTTITMASTVAGSSHLAADILTNIALGATAGGSSQISADLLTHITLSAGLVGFTQFTANFLTQNNFTGANFSGRSVLVAFFGPLSSATQSSKGPLVLPLEFPLPESLTNSYGIFQSDVIIRTALVAAMADLRANPWMIDYVFASLPKDAMTHAQYGEQEVARAKEWFLSTDIPVVLSPNIDAAKLPCISIALIESSENASTIGDVHYEPSEPADAGWPVLFGPFTPTHYSAATGIVQVNTNGFDLAADLQVIVDSKGQAYPILDVYDDNTFLIPVGTVADFTNATIRSPKPAFVVQMESVEFKESYNIGAHVLSEPVYLTYLHSILTFCLLRYKYALLDVRGFERSIVFASDFQLNGNYGKENVFSRFTTLTGYVRQYWPASRDPLISSIQTEFVVADTDHIAPGDSLKTATWIGTKDQS